MIPIDPATALAGIQSAVKLIKQASKTVDDVASLGPLLGKYFNAKSEATKAVTAAKKGGSSMGMAIEIEMALEQTREFEKELQMLFFQANTMDVWQKIKARASAMDVEEAHNARKEKEALARKKKKEQEELEMGLLIGGIILVFVLVGFGIFEMLDHCATHRCGR
jgi:CII-binding regulator of phage lambda lysogenization HflD